MPGAHGKLVLQHRERTLSGPPLMLHCWDHSRACSAVQGAPVRRRAAPAACAGPWGSTPRTADLAALPAARGTPATAPWRQTSPHRMQPLARPGRRSRGLEPRARPRPQGLGHHHRSRPAAARRAPAHLRQQ